MTTMVFSCAGQLLKQTVGLAMGGYCSPGLAIIVCMMHERAWCLRKQVRPTQLVAVRYVDDMTVVLVNTPAAKALLADLVQNALPPECELENEQPLGVSVRMLECAVSVLDGTVLITHHHKNAASLQESGVQQFRKFVDYSSAHPASVKQGVILGAFNRVLSNTSSSGATSSCILQLLTYLAELLLLQYPVPFLRRVVNRFFPRGLSEARQATWQVCAPVLLHMLRSVTV
jgi:hypothetical protein